MLSGIDIDDWERLPITPLYSVKPKTYVYVPECGMNVFFDHLDGMYSYCVDVNNDVVHLAASVDVHPLQRKGM